MRWIYIFSLFAAAILSFIEMYEMWLEPPRRFRRWIRFSFLIVVFVGVTLFGIYEALNPPVFTVEEFMLEKGNIHFKNNKAHNIYFETYHPVYKPINLRIKDSYNHLVYKTDYELIDEYTVQINYPFGNNDVTNTSIATQGLRFSYERRKWVWEEFSGEKIHAGFQGMSIHIDPNKILGIYSAICGLFGSLLIARGFLAKSLRVIEEESCAGRYVGNIHLAKSLIQQKWDIVFGFVWILLSYLFQLSNIALVFEINVNQHVAVLVVAAGTGISLFSIRRLRIRDGIGFVASKLIDVDAKQTAPLTETGAYLDQYGILGTQDENYIKEVASLLLLKTSNLDKCKIIEKINRRLAGDRRIRKEFNLPEGAIFKNIEALSKPAQAS